jgi:excisionase family DNA binding protein
LLRRNMTVGATTEAFLTVREAARRLKVSTATVYKACARGEMPCVRVLNVLRIPEGGLGGRGMVRGPGVSRREGSP